MKAILKPIFELLTGEFTLFGNVLYNYIAMSLVGLVSFAVAFGLVGRLYRYGVIEGRSIGSIIHWAVRLIVFVVVFYAFSLSIWIFKFIAAIPLWGWATFGAVVVAVIVLIALLQAKRLRSDKESTSDKEG